MKRFPVANPELATARVLLVLFLASCLPASPTAQQVTLEYRVKAAYLYNFVKFVEWPSPPAGSLSICVAGQNPFGSALEDLVRNERVRGLTIATRVILEPDPGCHVVFIPQTANVSAYLRAAANTPTLTVGEGAKFLEQGGIIRFRLDGGNVRFDINRGAAERAHLRISSRLLQLARVVDIDNEER